MCRTDLAGECGGRRVRGGPGELVQGSTHPARPQAAAGGVTLGGHEGESTTASTTAVGLNGGAVAPQEAICCVREAIVVFWI